MKRIVSIVSFWLFLTKFFAQFTFRPKVGYLATKFSVQQQDSKASLVESSLFGVFLRFGNGILLQPEGNFTIGSVLIVLKIVILILQSKKKLTCICLITVRNHLLYPNQKREVITTSLFLSCGNPTRTNDLWVMSPTSYQLLHPAIYPRISLKSFSGCKCTAFSQDSKYYLEKEMIFSDSLPLFNV